MADALLERFNQAYRNLDLFPLIEAQDIEDFRVDYGNATISRLKRLVLASEGTFVAYIPAIAGCHAWGQTSAAAQSELPHVFEMIR